MRTHTHTDADERAQGSNLLPLSCILTGGVVSRDNSCVPVVFLHAGEWHCEECLCARAWFDACASAYVSAMAELSAGMIPGRWGSVITQTCLHSKYVMKSCW